MNRFLILIFSTVSIFASANSNALAQSEEWVEIEKIEETYQLVKDAPSTEFNDRIYRFEITGTDRYTDNQLVKLVVWSSEFRPDVYVREASSQEGRQGNGEIIYRGDYHKEILDGQPNHVVRINFRPPETGDYRFVLTSNYDISDLQHTSTGVFNISGGMFEWRVPEVKEAQPITLGCSVAGVDADPGSWTEGEYGGVWTNDYDHNSSPRRTIRIMGFNFDWSKAQEMKDRVQNTFPAMTFIDMMTRYEACEYISNLECSHMDSFDRYCSEFGFAVKPELYVR